MSSARSVGYGTRTLLDAVSLGCRRWGCDRRRRAQRRRQDHAAAGVDRHPAARFRPGHPHLRPIGGLSAAGRRLRRGATVRDVIVGGRPDHVWAAEPDTRDVVSHLLSERRSRRRRGPAVGWRTAPGGAGRGTAGAGHDVVVLDEPTNHLDVEVIGWLADHLNVRRAKALVVVSHDRWFLDAVCTRTWEVHGGEVDAYDGGYAAYVLARAERMRLAAGTEARRQQPHAQGAGVASARSARADVETEVPDPGRQRADRQRAAAARFACAATLCDQQVGQGRVRPTPGAAGGRPTG